MLTTIWQDIRYGARVLLKNPGVTAVATKVDPLVAKVRVSQNHLRERVAMELSWVEY